MPPQREDNMRIEIDNPLLWKLLAIIAVSVLIVFATGCKTGKKLNTNSSGIIRVITPSDLIRQPNGTFKLKPKNPLPSKPVMTNKSVRSAPKIEHKSAEANPTTPNPKAAGKIKPFTPTVSASLTNVKLTPTVTRSNNKSTLAETPIKVNVRPKNTDPREPAPTENGGTPSEGSEKPSVNVKWLELGYFYFLIALASIGVWSIYDIYREYKSKKKSS